MFRVNSEGYRAIVEFRSRNDNVTAVIIFFAVVLVHDSTVQVAVLTPITTVLIRQFLHSRLFQQIDAGQIS